MAPRKTFKRVNKTRRLRIRRKLHKRSEHKRSPSNKRSHKRSHKKGRKTIRRIMKGGTSHSSIKGSELYREKIEGLHKINKNDNINEDTKQSPYYIILEACKYSCEALQPFIQTVHEIINKFDLTSKTIKEAYKEFTIAPENAAVVKKLSQKKGDGSAFSIADGMVQYILKKYLFRNHEHFVGEEADDITEKLEDGENIYTVNKNNIPYFLTPLIDEAIEKIKGYSSSKILKVKDTLDQLNIFLDPIDGTAEFTGDSKGNPDWPPYGKGHEATICIGFADNITKKAVAGFVYRPVNNDHIKKINTYALGWVENDKGYYDISHLDIKHPSTEPLYDSQLVRFLTSNGTVSQITIDLILAVNGKTLIPKGESEKNEDKGIDIVETSEEKEIREEREKEKNNRVDRENENIMKSIQVKSGGAGNKILMLLENKAEVYLQDRALSRWDTCAGEAILEAIGGRLCKLTTFFGDTGTIDERYHYTYTPELFGSELSKNSDPNPDALATSFNIKIFEGSEAEQKIAFKKYNGKRLSKVNLEGKDKFVNNINICGLFAIKDRSNTELIGNIKSAIDELIKSGEVFDY